jgi:hypothetical protein
MQYLQKIKNTLTKFKEYLVNEAPHTDPWYTYQNRGDYRAGWETEAKLAYQMRQQTNSRWPPVPDFYGSEVPLPPELREKMTVARMSTKAQTEQNYKHPSYCVCPSCKNKEYLTTRTPRDDPRFHGIDLSPEYYGAGSKITKFKPYYGTKGVTIYPTVIKKY